MGLAWTSDFVMDTEVEILCLDAVQCLQYSFEIQLCFNSSNFNKWNPLYPTYTRDGMGLAWTSDFDTDAEIEILYLQAVQCLYAYVLKISLF